MRSRWTATRLHLVLEVSTAPAPPSAPPDASDDHAREPVRPFKQFSYADWITVYEEKGTVTAACKAVGISRDTAYQRRRIDADFKALWDAAEQAVTEVLEKTLVEIAQDFDHKGQVRALEIALKSRRPEKYRESVKLEHGGTITHEIEVAVDRESAELEESLGLRAPEVPGPEASPPGDSPPRALVQGN